MTDAMEVIEATPRGVAYRGEQLEVRPLTIGAVPQIIRLARPVIDAVLKLQDLPDENSEELVDLAMDLIGQHGEALFGAVALAVGRDVEWVKGGDIEEFVTLSIALVKVNRDFFARRLGPLLAERQKARQTDGAGQTASSSSSSAATS